MAFFDGEIVDDFQWKVNNAIKRLVTFEPEDGYYLAFSGGKDSIVIYELAKMAKVKFDSHYAITTVDPPELTKFIKKHYPDVERHAPNMNMWDLIIKKRMPPTRVVRYCCDKLKEEGGQGRVCITGVRWDESARRKNTRKTVEYDTYGSQSKLAIESRNQFYRMNDDGKRNAFEVCPTGSKGKHIVNPIVEWTDEDVWKFIKMRNIPYCKLYDEGYKRLGCLACPMQGKHIVNDFYAFPFVFVLYLKAFHKMNINRKKDGLKTGWNNGHDVMRWWVDQSEEEYKQTLKIIRQSAIKKAQRKYVKWTKLDCFKGEDT